MTPGRAALLLIAAVSVASVRTAAGAAPARPNVVLVVSDDQRWDLVGAAGNRSVVTPALDRLAREGTYFSQATVASPQCVRSRATLLTGLVPHQLKWNFAESDAPGTVATLPALLRDAGYRTVLIGKWHLKLLPKVAGFTDVRTILFGGLTAYLDSPELLRGTGEELVTGHGFTNQIFGDDAVAFLESASAEREPFFLWLALTAPHDPRGPNPPDIRKLYEGKRPQDLWPPGLPRDAEPRDLATYYEAVSMADRQVGRVLDALDRRKLAARTLVVFLSDNGLLLGARGETTGTGDNQGKILPYEGAVRVPFVVRGPHVARGTNAEAVSSLDLPPTILAAAGLPVPATWPGRDLTKVLATGRSGGDGDVPTEFTSGQFEYRAVRTPTQKLIVWQRPRRTAELYDLVRDPLETTNLVDDPAAQAQRRDMYGRLRAWVRKTNDPAGTWIPMADDASPTD